MKQLKLLAAGLLLLAAVATAALAHGRGIVVNTVNPGGPAAAAGLQAGDKLLRIADQKIATLDDLLRIIAAHRPGDRVALAVERDGATVDLALTFGQRPDGGASISATLRVSAEAGEGGRPTEGTIECLAWIEKTYRVEALRRELKLEPTDDYQKIRDCVERDTQRMASANAIKYCDNVFKVHCVALDLLNEIAEAQVQRCEEQLGESLGIRPGEYAGWKTCAQHKVFDRYSMSGASSGQAACREVLLDQCGTNIDATKAAGTASPEQRNFVDCCSADDLGPDGRDTCTMLDGGFTRGPCHDRSVCINRVTTEWIHCSAPR